MEELEFFFPICILTPYARPHTHTRARPDSQTDYRARGATRAYTLAREDANKLYFLSY